MRRTSILATLLILSAGVFTLHPTDVTGGRAMPTVLLPSPESPLVDIRIEFRVGSIHERAGKEGLNYLTASTVAGGGTKDLTYQEILEKLYPMAANFGVHPGKEVTVFIATVHRDHLESFWDLFSDILLEPGFDEADFTRVKDLQLNFLTNVLRSTADEDLGKIGLENFIYENHPYGHAVYGTVKAVESFSLKAVKDFYKTYYTRENVTIGLAGGYPKDFPKRVSETLAKLPEGRVPMIALPRPDVVRGLHVQLIEKPASATAISLGFPIDITRSDRDYFALFFANSYLGEHRTFKGQLMRHLRGDRGLNYGDYSYVEYFEEYPGTVYPLTNIPRRQQYFSIWLRPVAHEHAHFALRGAIRELETLVKDGMSEEDFENTRSFLLGYTKLWGQSMSRRLGYALDSRFYDIDQDYLALMDKALRRLTVRDVNRAIKTYLQADDFKVVVVTQDAEALREALADNKPSPITYEVEKPEDIVKEDKKIAKYKLDVGKKFVEIVPAVEMFEE